MFDIDAKNVLDLMFTQDFENSVTRSEILDEVHLLLS
jgi:hypothetical protein